MPSFLPCSSLPANFFFSFSVDAVSDWEDALSYALSETYDGIILDIMMPKLSGLEVLQRLRAAGCRTPILLLTAKTEVEDRSQVRPVVYQTAQ